MIIVGGIDLSVGVFLALAGCLSVVLINHGLPMIIAVILSVLVGVVTGSLNGLLVTRLGIVPFVVTLASFNIFKGMAYIVTGGSSVPCTQIAFSKIGTGYIGIIPIPVIIMLTAMLISWIIMNKTVPGQKIYAVGGNVMAALAGDSAGG